MQMKWKDLLIAVAVVVVLAVLISVLGLIFGDESDALNDMTEDTGNATNDAASDDDNKTRENLSGTAGLQYKKNRDGTCNVSGIGNAKGTDIVVADKYKDMTVTGVEKYAFYGCEELKSVFLPNTIENIGKAAFAECTALVSVDMTLGVKSIAEGAFLNCESLESISLPDSLTSIEQGAFYGCDKLLVLEENIMYIQNWCVDYDHGAAQLTVREGTRGIAAHAFCRSTHGYIEQTEEGRLERVTLPASVICMGQDAFGGCAGLESLVYLGTAEAWQKTVRYESEGLSVNVTCTDGNAEYYVSAQN